MQKLGFHRKNHTLEAINSENSELAVKVIFSHTVFKCFMSANLTAASRCKMQNFSDFFYKLCPPKSLKDSYTGSYRNDFSHLTWSSLSTEGATEAWPQDKTLNAHSDIHNRVGVILGYYNGNNYLPEQIRSILDQSHQKLEIFIADDCSSSTVDVNELKLTPEGARRVHLGVRTSNVGFSKNFLGALSSIDTPFEYFAFSDQDDIWHTDKLENALAVLERYPKNKPALYCARTAIIDEHDQVKLGDSPLFKKPPSFANALVQSIAGGNTMVLNKVARDLVVRSAVGLNVTSHDWWCYQIISGSGGVVYYDPKPCLKYRQHTENLVGSNGGWAARFTRIRMLLKGDFRNWNTFHLTALAKNKALLTTDNQRCLDLFTKARQSGLCKRLYLSLRAGIYRQSLVSNLGLLLGLIFNKV